MSTSCTMYHYELISCKKVHSPTTSQHAIGNGTVGSYWVQEWGWWGGGGNWGHMSPHFWDGGPL